MSIKQRLEGALPEFVANAYRSFKFSYGFRAGKKSWSQEGEDLVLRKIFAAQLGFYVDVGAHHPYRYSNTYFLYKSGWSGINIDALPAAVDLFNRVRPKDINLQLGVASSNRPMIFYQFNDPAYSTFDRAVAERVQRSCPGIRLKGIQEIEVMRLDEILTCHLPEEKKIDLMNIDVEGMDMEVIRSNDWVRFRPRVLLVEMQGMSVAEALATEANRYLADKGYELYSKFANTAIFIDLEARGAV